MEACLDAALEAGHPFNEDCNARTGEGASFHDNNVLDGKRVSAADAYLGPALHRPNLTVRGGAEVRRVLLEGTMCRGVEYRRGQRVLRAAVEREVIVCAGAIPSPKLLLLSGIGPGEHLRSVGIDVAVDCPVSARTSTTT